MTEKRNIEIPEEWQKGMTLEEVIFPDNVNDIGFAIFSETENNLHVLRIYQLLRHINSASFVPVDELAAFSFEVRDELEEFIDVLPKITGLEMLVLINTPNPNLSGDE